MTNSQKNKFLFIMNYQNGLSREQKQFGLSSETPSVTYLLFVSFVNAKKDKLAMVFCSYCTHASSYYNIGSEYIRPSECPIFSGFSELRAESVGCETFGNFAFVRHD